MPSCAADLKPSGEETSSEVPSAARSSAAPSWSFYTPRQRWVYLAVLFLVSTSNYFDRYVISVLLEPIKSEFAVSDTMLGLLSGFCFALFYVVAGMPLARWADRGNRCTILMLAVTVWSVMTMLCGVAQTFLQLALARVGVGVGEAGAIPPSQSLLADYFPPKQRATAIAIFSSAGTAGNLLAFGIGGYIAATYGWRSAFLFAGASGLLLVLIARLTLVEPRLRQGLHSSDTRAESLGEALAKLRRKRSFLYGALGCLIYWFFAYGGFIFIPSMLIRVLRVPLAQVSVSYGIAVTIASVIGTLGGGFLADRLARRDVRWLAWLPAIAITLAAPLYWVAFSLDHLWAFIAPASVAAILLTGGLPPVFAAIHAVCGNARRATAVAIVFFSATLIGGGFGPLLTGAFSDALSSIYGTDGLRYALMIMVFFLVASGVCFYQFGRAMPADLEP